MFPQTYKTVKKGVFRVTKSISKKLKNRKQKIKNRTRRRNWDDQNRPMFSGSNIHYEFDGRHKGISYGGIGIIHTLAEQTGLIDEIDKRLDLLKRHLPYHESDHVLNIAYNLLAGGSCIEDIELLRNDEAWLNALGAEIIPDPTTAGDFLRRFDQDQIIELMEAKNEIRKQIWEKQPQCFKEEAIINVDGTIAETFGNCKEGMEISYNGKWGYHPLIISLANTREPLYLINRPANAPSHLDSAGWIDKSLDLTEGTFNRIRLRGDTDFSLSEHFDKWDERCIFVFGMDARQNLVKLANDMTEWDLLERDPRYAIKTRERRRPQNVKKAVVKKKKFKRIQTESEYLAEFPYQPGKCGKTYRMVVLKKELKTTRGELQLFDDVRYFFYITNDLKSSKEQVLEFYRKRADHENDIEQLKNGARALQAPSNTLLSNWAYMVVASTAWDLKAWYGLLMPYRHMGKRVVRMEFKSFINSFIRIPCLIIRTARKIVYRLVGYNDFLKHALNFFRAMKQPGFS